MNAQQNPEFELPNERHDLKILQSLRRIIRSIDLNSKRLISQYDITSPQLVSLQTIAIQSPTTIAKLSKEVFLSASTLVGIIDRLEQKKLVTRERNGTDRRQVMLTITPEGDALLKKAPSTLQDRLSAALDDLSGTDQALIATVLDRLVNLMEAESLDAAPILQTGDF